MDKVTESTLHEMTDVIVREVHPSLVVLFGSRAQGTARPESDVDLLIVERDPFGGARSRRAEISRIRRAVSSFGFAKDILVYSSEEVDKWRKSLNHIIATALRQGKVLYAAE